jgi:hypothetical protein
METMMPQLPAVGKQAEQAAQPLAHFSTPVPALVACIFSATAEK